MKAPPATRHAHIVMSPWFLCALGVLLLNDHLLKVIYGNWLTGKLSDFAGLYMVGLLLFAWKPRAKHITSWLLAVFFLAWKSPLADLPIALFNTFMPYSIVRTIDYTDLLACIMIPVAARHKMLDQAKSINLSNLIKPVVMGLTVFAIMATSRARPDSTHFSFEPPSGTSQVIQRSELEGIVQNSMHQFALEKTPLNHFDKIYPYSNPYFAFDYSIEPNSRIQFSLIEKESGCVFFCHDTQADILKFRHSLEQGLSRYPNAQIILQLNR